LRKPLGETLPPKVIPVYDMLVALPGARIVYARSVLDYSIEAVVQKVIDSPKDERR
jgi:hypothetical protein